MRVNLHVEVGDHPGHVLTVQVVVGAVDVPHTPVGVVVAVGACAEGPLGPQRGSAPVVVVVRETVHLYIHFAMVSLAGVILPPLLALHLDPLPLLPPHLLQLLLLSLPHSLSSENLSFCGLHCVLVTQAYLCILVWPHIVSSKVVFEFVRAQMQRQYAHASLWGRSTVLEIFSDLLELVELGPQPLDLVLHRRSTGLPDLFILKDLVDADDVVPVHLAARVLALCRVQFVEVPDLLSNILHEAIHLLQLLVSNVLEYTVKVLRAAGLSGYRAQP